MELSDVFTESDDFSQKDCRLPGNYQYGRPSFDRNWGHLDLSYVYLVSQQLAWVFRYWAKGNNNIRRVPK